MHIQYSPNFTDQNIISYIVPYLWWKNYYSNHFNFITDATNIINQDIHMTDLIDTTIIQFEEYYINLLSEKSNGIQFRNRFISPPLLQGKRYQQDYNILTSQQWASLQISKQKKIPAIIFGLKKYQAGPNEIVEQINGLHYVTGQKQFQIILCTDKDSDIFIGCFPNNMNLIDAIKLILKEMKFVELPQTKIIFADYEKQVATSFSKHQFVKVKSLSDLQTFIIITNLYRTPIDDDQQCRSDRAINGEDKDNKKMMEQLPPVFEGAAHLKTISTGASTPLTFSQDSQRNDFQIMEMFREKTIQQIQEMKKYGNMIIYQELIKIESECTENELKNDLLVMSEQIIESLNYKKKNKEK